MLSCNHSISESRWDPATCSCGCPRRQFGEEEAACKVERQADWDPSTCTCQPRIARVSQDSWDSSTVPTLRWWRGGSRHSSSTTPARTCPACTTLQGGSLSTYKRLDDQPYRVHYRSLDIAGWVLLGSCISLVIILAGTTWHYRWLDVELWQYLGAHQLFILDWKSAFQAKGKTSEGGTVGKKAFVQEEHLEEEEVWQGGGGYWI